MKNNRVFVLLITAFLYSCSPTKIKTLNPIYDSTIVKLHEGNRIYNCKNEIFIRCLKRLYPQDFSTFFDSTDASSIANMDRLDYNKETIQFVDSLASKFVMRPTASWTIENRRVSMNVCLSYRNSVELDSTILLFYQRHDLMK